jgi:hypothetical protein
MPHNGAAPAGEKIDVFPPLVIPHAGSGSPLDANGIPVVVGDHMLSKQFPGGGVHRWRFTRTEFKEPKHHYIRAGSLAKRFSP